MDSSSLASISVCNGNPASASAGACAGAGAGENSIVKHRRCSKAHSSLSSTFRSSLSFSSSMPYTENSTPSSPGSSSLDQFNGIPFAWEQSPGIPKDYSHPYNSKLDPSMVSSSLPLPPLTATNNNPVHVDVLIRKQTTSRDRSKSSSTTNDPFVAALVKCSTTDHRRHHVITEAHNHRKSRVTLSDRFGFVDLSTSCIRGCDVLESNVLVPKSTRMLNGSRSS